MDVIAGFGRADHLADVLAVFHHRVARRQIPERHLVADRDVAGRLERDLSVAAAEMEASGMQYFFNMIAAFAIVLAFYLRDDWSLLKPLMIYCKNKIRVI